MWTLVLFSWQSIWRIINWSQLHTKLLSTAMNTMRLLTCFLTFFRLCLVTSVKFRATTLLINNINYSVSLKRDEIWYESWEFWGNKRVICIATYFMLLLQKLTNKNWQYFGAHLFKFTILIYNRVREKNSFLLHSINREIFI